MHLKRLLRAFFSSIILVVLFTGAGCRIGAGRKETKGGEAVGAVKDATAEAAGDRDLYSPLSMAKPSKEIAAFEFTANSLDGKSVKLSDFRGKVVFLNFWATWCGPCKSEVGDIDRLGKLLKGEAFAVVAVDIREDEQTIRSFMKRERIDFPVYLDPDGQIAGRYGVNGIPTTFIIDPDGKIVGRAIGARPWADAASLEFMRSFMK